VHVPEAAILPPLKLKLVSVATGANAGVPHPVVVIPGGLATSTPAGNASVNATPVSPVPAFGFTISIVNVLVPPAAIVSATNVFVTVGARIAVTVSLSVFEVTPSCDGIRRSAGDAFTRVEEGVIIPYRVHIGAGFVYCFIIIDRHWTNERSKAGVGY